MASIWVTFGKYWAAFYINTGHTDFADKFSYFNPKINFLVEAANYEA